MSQTTDESRSPNDNSRGDNSRADNSRADNSRADNSRADSSRADSSRADSSRADSSRADSSRADSSRADNSRADSSRADSSRADNSRADNSRADNSRGDVSRIELTIPAGSEWVRVARLTVAGVASRLPFPVDAVEDIKLAVTEAINNAIQHAPLQLSQGDGHETPTILIRIETSPDGLWVNVTDSGRLQEELPVASATRAAWSDDLPEGGLGLMLIRSLMDEVDQRSGPSSDTSVRMFKRVPQSHSELTGARRPPIAR